MAIPVYPRWRGEHCVERIHILCDHGLSPLARGTHAYARKYPFMARFIPAGAGNTSVTNFQSPTQAVYPRWRGEHKWFSKIRRGISGLSPLARGTHKIALKPREFTRFIPAGAGNTPKFRLVLSIGSVYPRWRGEHFGESNASELIGGLSPLARGTQRAHLIRVASTRFIPAGAGNTCGNALSITVIPVYPRWRGEHVEFLRLYRLPLGLSPLARGTL
ncbi:Domain of uncharacterised function (DUF2825) [Serratia marcescens]|nr:Domain of uncharacterised function (DUF2825) [Serratia marcescens]CAI1153648.1 Domain of uncharacterised function (DUF2825) [Serratia marcescens]